MPKEKNLRGTVNKRDLKRLTKYCDDSSSFEFFQSKAERSYAKSDHSWAWIRRTRKRLKHSMKKQSLSSQEHQKRLCFKKEIMKWRKYREKQRTSKSRQHQLEMLFSNNSLAVQGNNIESKVPCMMITTWDNSKIILPLQPAHIVVLPLDKDGYPETDLRDLNRPCFMNKMNEATAFT